MMSTGQRAWTRGPGVNGCIALEEVANREKEKYNAGDLPTPTGHQQRTNECRLRAYSIARAAPLSSLRYRPRGRSVLSREAEWHSAEGTWPARLKESRLRPMSYTGRSSFLWCNSSG
jgi:hypothetical protein|mmetsp:Transcript_63732/g.106338  ORF Transcript_63732/g.106338 Transcript_63732/m.106338 type:complete len:117 (-) Transcript_63732:374-724(-)